MAHVTFLWHMHQPYYVDPETRTATMPWVRLHSVKGDLQTWFNLAWCGYTAERLYPELAELKRKGRHFTEAEKNRVLDIHLEIMGLVLGKYRTAEERGQIELTTTPFFHPILPLVYDSQ